MHTSQVSSANLAERWRCRRYAFVTRPAISRRPPTADAADPHTAAERSSPSAGHPGTSPRSGTPSPSLGSGLRRVLESWLTVSVCVLTVAVLIVARRAWVPLGDNALMRMWTDAVGSRRTPLVGGDSRFGWNHLGPWLFYLLAIPYRLTGRSAVGLLIGAGAINIGSIVMCGRCIRSLATDRVAALVCAGSVVWLLTAPGSRLIDPWNPYVAVLPFLLAAVACWAVLSGAGGWLAWLLAAGSVSVQSHITFLAPVAVLVILSCGAVVLRRTTLTRSQWASAVTVVVVAWLPAIIDMFRPGGRNLWRVVQFFTTPSPTSPTAGIRAGISVVLHATGPHGDWLGGQPTISVITDVFDGRLGPLPGLGLVALVSGGVLSWRWHDRRTGLFVAVVSSLLATGVVEMAAARGPLYPYLFAWVGVVGMLAWLTPVMALGNHRSSPHVDDLARAVAVLAAITLTASVILGGLPRSPREHPADAAIVQRLVSETILQLDPHRRYQLLHGHDSFNSIYELGVIDELRERHIDIVVSPAGVVLFGRHMTDANASRFAAIEIVSPIEAAMPNDRVLALSDPLSGVERQEEVELTHLLVDAYQRTDHPDAARLIATAEGDVVLLAGFVAPDAALQPSLERLAALRRRGRSVAVILRDPPP